MVVTDGRVQIGLDKLEKNLWEGCKSSEYWDNKVDTSSFGGSRFSDVEEDEISDEDLDRFILYDSAEVVEMISKLMIEALDSDYRIFYSKSYTSFRKCFDDFENMLTDMYALRKIEKEYRCMLYAFLERYARNKEQLLNTYKNWRYE